MEGIREPYYDSGVMRESVGGGEWINVCSYYAPRWLGATRIHALVNQKNL